MAKSSEEWTHIKSAFRIERNKKTRRVDTIVATEFYITVYYILNES